jgi:hypothetical protein
MNYAELSTSDKISLLNLVAIVCEKRPIPNSHEMVHPDDYLIGLREMAEKFLDVIEKPSR